MSNYRFYIGAVEVFPLNGGIGLFNYERKPDPDIVFERSLSQELIFEQTSGAFDFKAQEATRLSQELDFIIHKKCGSTWAIDWEGAFTVAEGYWDNDGCIFKVKPRVKEYMFPDIQVNVLDILANVTRPAGGGIPAIIGVITDTNPFSGPGQRNYTQAKHLRWVLDYVAKKSNPKIQGVISDFFQINPLNAFPLPVTNYYGNLVMCSLSDVQEPVPSGLATEEFITFKELTEDLNLLFDVFWFIDSNYNLRIEHRTFFDGVLGLDLTLPQYEKYLIATDKYTYDLKDYPRNEFWRSASGPQYVQLTYDQLGKIIKNRNQKTYQPKKLHTDYANIRYRGQNSSNDGFFLFATTGNTFGGYQMLQFSPDWGQNAPLTPHNLVRNLHKYSRPYIHSLYESLTLINTLEYYKSGGFTALTIKPTKQQIEISVPLCCGDNFNVVDQIQTNLGLGFVEKATFEQKTDQLKLTLKYALTNDDEVLPTDIPNCDLWLRGDQGVTYDIPYFLVNGIKLVEQWDDYSGNLRHAVCPAPGNRPIWNDANGWIEFSGNVFLRTPAFQLFPSKRGTIFLFYTGNSGASAILSTNGGGAGVDWDIINIGGGPATINETSAYPADYAPAGIYVLNRVLDQETQVFQNGLEVLTSPYVGPNTQPASKVLQIGDNPSVVAPGGLLKLSEVIIYGRSLSDDERQKVEIYFAKKGNYLIYP